MILACDIDGVLCENDGPTCAAVNARLGLALNPAEMDSWDWLHRQIEPHTPDPHAVLMEYWGNPVFISTLPFILPALPAIRRIKGLVDQVHIVTSRGLEHKGVQDATRLWLDHYGIDYDRIVHTNAKTAYCQAEGIEYLIEDAPHHAWEAAHAGVQVMLVSKPYNLGVPSGKTGVGRGGITRIDHIGEAPAVLLAALGR